MDWRSIFSMLLAIACAAPAAGQDRLLTIDDIDHPDRRVRFSGSAEPRRMWLNDGEHYLELETDEEAHTSRLIQVHAPSGARTPYLDATRMEAALAGLPGVSDQEAKSLSSRQSYVMDADRSAFLINHGNDLFYYPPNSDRAIRLTHTPEPETEEAFSPDGRMVSFVRRHNLFVVETETGRERALTTGGDDEILNGRLDWVYQEEVYGRGNFKGYWWSPDSTAIAYLQIDESPVKPFTIVDHLSKTLRLEVTRYPKAGDPNSGVRLGITSAAGGNTRWVDTARYEPDEHLIVRVGWTPDSRQLAYQVQDREQTWLDLNIAQAESGQSASIVRETSEAWVNVNGEPRWLEDGSFLWLSERTGRRHLYHYSADGSTHQSVTSGQWDIQRVHGVDEERGWIYFSGSEASPIGLHTYRVRLDGTELARLTDAEGTHRSSFDPTFAHFIDSWSDIHTPPQVRLHRADGDLIRIIDENRVDELRQYRLGSVEFLKVHTRDGFVMEAMMIKPPDFDPSRKYPVLVYTYGGPSAPQVRNRWAGRRHMWHQMLAQKGYIIWICDNRTASGKGVESAWPLYKNFGELELRDIEDGLEWLKRQPYVASSRIGIWGTSFGGYMTAYALTHSKSFRIGVALSPVTDWTLYDTIYTERYMMTPQKNPEGYERSSALRAAGDLKGRLLLIHGTIDDNVHMENSIRFVHALQKADKPFDLMLYPDSRHAIVDPLLLKHVRALMTRFILDHL